MIFLFPAYSPMLVLCRYYGVAVFPAIVARVRQSINSGLNRLPSAFSQFLWLRVLVESADISNVTYEW